jgi:predicted DsbA family dithiol-disulfide isomerase
MRVDIWSDVVCPWCYIGFVRLDKALAQYGGTSEVYHHSFQLDPRAGEPTPAVENLAGKYGIALDDAKGMMQQVSEIAETEGLKYRLADTNHGNTKLAHNLLAFAAIKGVQHELLLSLFNAYFEKAENVFSIDDLIPHAINVGLDEAEVRHVLETEQFSEVLQYDKELGVQLGVQGVPYFVFNQRVVVSGAEQVSTFLQAMARADELVAEEA